MFVRSVFGKVKKNETYPSSYIGIPVVVIIRPLNRVQVSLKIVFFSSNRFERGNVNVSVMSDKNKRKR